MNRYRLGIMFVLILMMLTYGLGIINISEATNFSVTLAALIFSVSSVIDTFATENKVESAIRFILDTMAIAVAIILPNINDVELVKKLTETIDTNTLLILSLFFTMAGQWATEIKLKDFQRKIKKSKQ